MSNKHCGPDIVKYFVVEPTNNGGATTGSTGNFFVCSGTTFLSTISGCTNGVDFNGNTFYNSGDVFFNGVITACTGIHTSNIYGCSPITVHDELILLNKLTLPLSAVTQDDTLTQILGIDSSTGEVKYRSVESIITGATSQDTFVTGFTYDDSNNLTISRNDGTVLTTNIDTMSGLTINGDLLVTGTTNISGLTSINSSLDVYNGTIGLRDNDYFLQGTSTGGTNVQLIGVYSNNEILIGNQGYTNRIMDDTIIKGELDILSGLTLSQTPTLNNSGTDILIRNSSTGEVEYRPVSGITPDTNTFVTGFTYDGSNTFSIIDNSGNTFNATINTVTGLTSNGDVEVIGNLIVTGGTGNVLTKQVYVEDNLGLDWDFPSSSVVLGNNSDGTIINGTNLTINSDTTINGNLSATTISATTYFGDGSNLTGIDNFYVSGGTYNVGTNNINFSGNNVVTTFDVDLTSLVSSVSGDTFVVSGNADAATSLLTFTNNSGGTFNVTNSAALFSDNDINVTGGTYNPSNGCITFGTNSGTTFDVCGFVTGFTDSYTTDAYLSGTEVKFDNSVEGSNYYNVDLNPLLSGKTDNTTFNTYTANTQTILDGKIDSANNVGGTNEFFKDKSGTTLNFRTLSGGSNTTVSTVGDVVKVDVTIPPTTNTFVTGFTYNDANTFTISRNDGVDLSTSINTMTGLTVNGSISATTYFGDGSNLTGISTDDNYVTGGTLNSGTLTLERQNGIVTITGFTNDVDTFSTGGTVTQSATSGSSQVTIQITGNDGFTPYNITGLTDTFVNDFSFSSNTFTITQNDGSTFDADVDTIDLANILSGVTFNIATSGSISATTFNGGTFNGTFVGDGSGLTGITDNNTFVTGTTFSSNQAILSRNDGFEVFKFSGGSNVNLSNPSTNEIKIDVSLPPTMNTFTTGFTYNNANTFTITDNDSGVFNASINTMTGLTVNGTLSATTYFGDGSNLTGISSEDNFVTGGTFSSETLTLNRQNGSVTITGFTSTPSLNDGEIFVGNTGNTAQSVAMSGDVNIDNTGLTTIQPDVVTYDKMQDVTQRAILGSENVSGGTVTEIPVIDQFLSTGVVTALLSDTTNWDINGNYTGSTISGTFQSQMYYDGNYFFIAVLDNTWIRLIRG